MSESENKNQGGRPSKYWPVYADQVYRLTLLGLTDKEIAVAFNVDVNTIDRWKIQFPEFGRNLRKGKVHADARVAQSLFRRATGYSHKAVKIFYDTRNQKTIEVPYIERYPPDPASMIFWLKNRRPDLWRDKIEVKHSQDLDEMREKLAEAVGVDSKDLPN